MRKWTRRTALNEAHGDSASTVSNFQKDQQDAGTLVSTETKENSLFESVIVEEVISNPEEYFNRPWPEEDRTYDGKPITLGDVFSERVKIDDKDVPISNPWQIETPSLIDFIPPNSIKGFRVKSKNGGSGSKSIICFPFFSSHLSLPVKPGETVWVTSIEGRYYWISRKPSLRQIEDLNYTFDDREENVKSIKNSLDVNTYVHFEGKNSLGNSVDFQSIMINSLAYKEEFTGEPVPRNSKDCGDLLLQGSNNSHIYLGKEKFEIENTVSQEVFTASGLIDSATPERKPVSPAIDICVLRKKNEIFNLKNSTLSNNINSTPAVEVEEMSAVSSQHRDANLRYYENEKSRDISGKEIFSEEFYDSDIHNCIARVYMTNASTIDDILFAPDYLGEPDMSAAPQDITGVGNYGTMVALGSNARLVGTETVKIHNIAGSSGVQFTPQGDVIIFANTEGGAKIVLESGGDIRIVPGENGVLKLGSDNADTVPLGGSQFEIASPSEGIVGYTPATTTSGGLIADPADLDRANPAAGLPKYSSKCLFK